MSEGKYCDIIENKKNVLYEDEAVIAIVPERPITKGHVQIISKKHCESMQDLEDKEFQHMVYSASFTATALFENLEAQGTNLIANTGGELNKGGHFHIDVLARKTDDGLNFLWTPKKLPEEEIKSVQEKIKDKCDLMGVEQKKKEVVDLDKKPEKLESSEEKASKECSKSCKTCSKTEEKGEGKTESEAEKEKEEEKKELPSEEEQRYKKKEAEREKKEKEVEEDKESYLIKQLRRVP
jgi:diadenosine tetraphosphate (Ap4A) HIT family hydrolase